MNENYRNLKLGRKEYRLVFTTQAMLEVTRRYGGIEKMADKLQAMERKP